MGASENVLFFGGVPIIMSIVFEGLYWLPLFRESRESTLYESCRMW